jgi:hypothetical protein
LKINATISVCGHAWVDEKLQHLALDSRYAPLNRKKKKRILDRRLIYFNQTKGIQDFEI